MNEHFEIDDSTIVFHEFARAFEFPEQLQWLKPVFATLANVSRMEMFEDTPLYYHGTAPPTSAITTVYFYSEMKTHRGSTFALRVVIIGNIINGTQRYTLPPVEYVSPVLLK